MSDKIIHFSSRNKFMGLLTLVSVDALPGITNKEHYYSQILNFIQMKNVLKTTVLIFALFLISNIAAAQKTNGKIVIKTTLHCNHCKECETCGLKFKTEMLKIKGIKMYELDEAAQTFTIYYNPKKTTPQAIREGISRLGFDADGVKATAEGIASLDQCCKA